MGEKQTKKGGPFVRQISKTKKISRNIKSTTKKKINRILNKPQIKNKKKYFTYGSIQSLSYMHTFLLAIYLKIKKTHGT